jgi:hypothetical protein
MHGLKFNITTLKRNLELYWQIVEFLVNNADNIQKVYFILDTYVNPSHADGAQSQRFQYKSFKHIFGLSILLPKYDILFSLLSFSFF